MLVIWLIWMVMFEWLPLLFLDSVLIMILGTMFVMHFPDTMSCLITTSMLLKASWNGLCDA